VCVCVIVVFISRPSIFSVPVGRSLHLAPVRGVLFPGVERPRARRLVIVIGTAIEPDAFVATFAPRVRRGVPQVPDRRRTALAELQQPPGLRDKECSVRIRGFRAHHKIRHGGGAEPELVQRTRGTAPEGPRRNRARGRHAVDKSVLATTSTIAAAAAAVPRLGAPEPSDGQFPVIVAQGRGHRRSVTRVLLLLLLLLLLEVEELLLVKLPLFLQLLQLLLMVLLPGRPRTRRGKLGGTPRDPLLGRRRQAALARLPVPW
jgi:hypothetical protein